MIKHNVGSVASQMEADMTCDTVTTPPTDLPEGNADSVQTAVPSGSEDPLSSSDMPESADNHSGPSDSTAVRSEPSGTLESVDSFVLRLRSNNVTEKTCRDILEYMEAFTKEAIKEHSELVEAGSGQARTQPHCLQTLNDALKSSRLDKHALRSCRLTTPQTITLCADAAGKADTYEYVPLIPQLKQFCQDENILLSASDDNTELHGICDGSIHKDSAKNTVHLSVYYDGFQVGNPLSSKASDSKIGAVYCAIINLKGGIQMKRIMLLMTFYEGLLKKHSWAQLLEPLIEELSELEREGICLESGTTVPVRLAAVLGDNLGVHSIGGFSTAFSGGAMMCRHCLGSKEDIQHKTTEKDFQPRTREEYATKMRLLEDCDFDEKMCSAFGLKRPCPFDSLKEFHCMTSMPPDVMHDLLEGVIPSTISLVTSKLIEDNIVSLEDLNKSIRAFPYVRLDVNHPGPLRRDGRRIVVKGKASELWCLLRLFPLILLLAGVPSAVLSRNTCIQLVSKLIGIVLLAVAFTISHAEATSLHNKVEEFLSDLRNVFPAFKLTPKYHYLLHYRDQILRHGPLRHLWSMRFEGKHQVLKQSVTTSKNRKNLPKTLATRHQVKQYVERNDQSDSGSRPVLFRGTLTPAVMEMVKDATFFRRATFNGTEYNSGDVVQTYSGMKQILGVADFPDGRYLVVQCQTCLYDAAIGAFLMTPEDDIERTQLPEDSSCRTPMGAYNVRGTTYVVPRHHMKNCGMLPT